MVWHFWSEHAEEALARRKELVRLLEERTGGRVDAFGTGLVYTELVGNVVRHAPGPIDITVDLVDDAAILHVEGKGPEFELRRDLPPDALSEHGRGLFLVRQFAREVKVQHVDDTTEVCAVVPLRAA